MFWDFSPLITFKPIFHCNTKPLALGPGVRPPTPHFCHIGGIRRFGVGAGVGHVHFKFFNLCQFHLRLVANTNVAFSGIWALVLKQQ